MIQLEEILSIHFSPFFRCEFKTYDYVWGLKNTSYSVKIVGLTELTVLDENKT